MLNKMLIDIPKVKSLYPGGESYWHQLIHRPASPVNYMATNFYPTILEAGLVASLKWLTSQFEEKNNIPFQFSSNVSAIKLDPLIAIGLFNIAQEACNNIIKHANASSVTMHLYQGANKLELEIIDNGSGMDTLLQQHAASRGLRKMKQRALSMGGDCLIASAAEKGTLIKISVPLFTHT